MRSRPVVLNLIAFFSGPKLELAPVEAIVAD